MAYKKVEPSVFKFEKSGDMIEGYVLKIDDSKKYDKNKVYHIEDTDKKIWILWGSTVLDDRMTYSKVGDKVKIVFDGIEKNKKNQDMKMFSVFIDQK